MFFLYHALLLSCSSRLLQILFFLSKSYFLAWSLACSNSLHSCAEWLCRRKLSVHQAYFCVMLLEALLGVALAYCLQCSWEFRSWSRYYLLAPGTTVCVLYGRKGFCSFSFVMAWAAPPFYWWWFLVLVCKTEAAIGALFLVGTSPMIAHPSGVFTAAVVCSLFMIAVSCKCTDMQPLPMSKMVD